MAAESKAGYSFADPAGIGLPVIIEYTSVFDGHGKAQVTVLEIERGEMVWLSLRLHNRDNSPPVPGFEYIAALIRFEVLESSGTYTIQPNYFETASSQGREYNTPPYFVFEYQPSLNAFLRAGESHTGYAAFQVPIYDSNPLLGFSSLPNSYWWKLFS